jgi:hypothetical protein
LQKKLTELYYKKIMKYNVGDKVQIKSLDWYNENKDKDGRVNCGYHTFIEKMSKFCGQTMIVCQRTSIGVMTMADNPHYWTDEMIEGLVEETKPFTYDETVEIIETMQGIGDSWECPQGYQFVDENGNVINAQKIVLEKKKPKYPKTYEECCEVLSIPSYYKVKYATFEHGYNEYTTLNKLCSLQDKLNTLGKLLICRDAYWKLFGEEMGLGKPWEPDWNDVSDKYCIYFVSGYAWSKECQTRQCTLAFPTSEMRDYFYQYFKELIEQCKELL